MKLLQRLSVLAALMAVAMSSGCGQQPTVLQNDDSHGFADAVRIYQTNCQTCHGENLQGKIGPSLQHVGATMTREQIDHRIRYGGGPMPGYGPENQGILTNAQINALTAWLVGKK